MKRKPTFAPYIGSIVNGHNDTPWTISHLAHALHDLLDTCRVDRETRKAHTELLWSCEHVDFADIHNPLERLTDALTHYAPPYTTFGERDGEWGFWPQLDAVAELPKMLDWAKSDTDIATLWDHEVSFVNPQGNLGCGRFDKRGRFHSYWSAV